MIRALRHGLLDMLPGPLAGQLRTWWLRRLIRRFSARVVTRTYGAGSLRVHVGDPLAEGWYDHDWDELPEIAALRQTRLRPGALVFDLGAHQGVVAMMLAREVGPAAKRRLMRARGPGEIDARGFFQDHRPGAQRSAWVAGQAVWAEGNAE